MVHAWIKPKNHGIVNDLRPVDLSYLYRKATTNEVIERPTDKQKAWQYSLLDTVPSASFVLFHSGSSWTKKAFDLKNMFTANHLPVVTLEIGKDFDFVDRERGKMWTRGYGLNKGNALLVRPDHHVESIIPSNRPLQAVVDSTLYSFGL
jgi:hypothetical protein